MTELTNQGKEEIFKVLRRGFAFSDACDAMDEIEQIIKDNTISI